MRTRPADGDVNIVIEGQWSEDCATSCLRARLPDSRNLPEFRGLGDEVFDASSVD